MKSEIFCLALIATTGISSGCSLTTTGDTPTPTPTVVFQDDFTGTDGASLSSSWAVTTASGATFDISSNRAHPSQGSGPSPIAMYSTQLDKVGYTTTVDLIISGGSYAGDAYIAAKSSVSTSLVNTYICGVNGATGKVMLAKIVSGTTTELAMSSAAISLPDGATAALSFDVQGFLGVSMTCKLTLNGTEHTVTATDSTFFAAGYWGLFGGDSAGNTLYFDNFKIVN